MADLNAVLPWHGPALASLLEDRARLPHALMVCGPDGVGKRQFALALAARLLCSQDVPGGAPSCGHCVSCRLLLGGTHPDLHLLIPEARANREVDYLGDYAKRYPPERKKRTGKKESAVITVDQVRELIDRLGTSAHTATCKVALLWPADEMNANAANALLKLLEEPPADSVIVLVTSLPQRLPATVRSRCVRVPLGLPEEGQALGWLAGRGLDPARAGLMLQLAGGAPLRAAGLDGEKFAALRERLLADLAALAQGKAEPTECAARWNKAGTRTSLDWFARCLADLACLKACPAPPRLYNPGNDLKRLAEPLDLRRLIELWSSACRAMHQADTPLDGQLLIEDVLIDWMRGARRRGPTEHAR